MLAGARSSSSSRSRGTSVPDPLHVVSVAIRLPDGAVYSKPPPARHHTLIRELVQAGHEIPIRGDQGFLLSNGEFAGRFIALRVARKAGQLLQETSPANGLFSEDVW